MKKRTTTTFLLCVLWSSLWGQQLPSDKTTIDPIGYLKLEPSENSKTLSILPKGDTVFLYDWYERPYVKVAYKNEVAFISIACLSFNADLVRLLQKHSKIPIVSEQQTSPGRSKRTANCSDTANCGCSGKNKSECGGPCCHWIVGSGCRCL